jgi:phosphoribosylformylglycinamidine cyclo-ligase
MARMDPRRWSVPSVMRLFGALGGLEDDELHATFNGGLGMVLVVPPAAIPAAIRVAAAHGVAAMVVGEVAEGSSGGAVYVEGELESVA